MKIIALSLLILALCVPTSAQTFFRHRVTKGELGASFQRPIFADGATGYSGFIATLAGALPIRGNAAFLVELPFMQGSYTDPFLGQRDEFGIGNALIGIQVEAGSLAFIDFDVRLPIASSSNSVAASIANATDIRHFGAYTPQRMTVQAAVNVDAEVSPSLFLTGRIGPQAMFRTKGSSTGDLFAEYGAAIETRTPELALWVGWGALTQISNRYGTDNTIDEAELGGSYMAEHTAISLRLRAPLDEYLRRTITWTYGVTLTYAP